MFWKGAVQVPLNLLRGEVVLPHGLLHEVLIVAGVGGLLVDGPWETPNGASVRKWEPRPWLPDPAPSPSSCEDLRVTAGPLPSSRSTGSQRLKNSPVRYDPLEKRMATHSSIHAWRAPWMEGPGELQSRDCGESNTTE